MQIVLNSHEEDASKPEQIIQIMFHHNMMKHDLNNFLCSIV